MLLLNLEVLAFIGIICLNGGWMIVDGLYALKNKKFIGPDKPGPWASIVIKLGIDPLSMALPFVVLGIVWFLSGALLLSTGLEIFWIVTLLVVIATLWYLPFGTILAFFQIIILVLFKASFV